MTTEGNTKTKKKRTLPPKMQEMAEKMKRGEIVSPGRPKGSRNKFSEKFVQDFMAHWEKHGTEALDKCFKKEIGIYMTTAARIMPKDFNINMTDEAAIDKLLDKFTTEQLRDLAAGLAAIGASHRSKTIEGTARREPDQLH